MQVVVVAGRFVNEVGEPLEGAIMFVPSDIWVEENGIAYPTFAPAMDLLDDGGFQVNVSRTDTADKPWYYTVYCPVGKWKIVIEDDGPLQLRNLLPERFA